MSNSSLKKETNSNSEKPRKKREKKTDKKSEKKSTKRKRSELKQDGKKKKFVEEVEKKKRRRIMYPEYVKEDVELFGQSKFKNYVNRTAILINYFDEVGICPQDLVVDVPGSPFVVDRNSFGCTIDGVAEYCRIGYDMFSQDAKISVFTAGEDIIRHNNWFQDQQQLSQITCRVPKNKAKSNNLIKGIEDAVTSLSEPLPVVYPHRSNATRIIIVFQDQNQGESLDRDMKYSIQGNSLDIASIVCDRMLNQNRKVRDLSGETPGSAQLIVQCDIVLICIVPEIYGTLPPPLTSQISANISVELNYVRSSDLKSSFTDLAVSHFNLSAVEISGFPSNTKERSQKMHLLYSNANSVKIYDTISHHGEPLGNSFWKTQKTIRVNWFENNNYPYSISTYQRVSPYKYCSDENRALIKMISEKKSCYLKSIDAGNIYQLKQMNGIAYLCSLFKDNIDLHSFPISYNYDYHHLKAKFRLEEFKFRIVKSNTFKYANFDKQKTVNLKTNEGKKSNLMTSPSMKRITKYFPLEFDETLLFNTQAYSDTQMELLLPILHSIPEKEISDIKTIFDSISRIVKISKENSSLLFPTASSEARERLHIKLWQELRTYVEQFKTSSDLHEQIMNKIDSVWPELNPKPVEIEEVKSQTDTNQYMYIPQYAYETQDPKVRKDIKGMEARYADRTKQPRPIGSKRERPKNPNSLFCSFWNNQGEKKQRPQFDGFPIPPPELVLEQEKPKSRTALSITLK